MTTAASDRSRPSRPSWTDRIDETKFNDSMPFEDSLGLYCNMYLDVPASKNRKKNQSRVKFDLENEELKLLLMTSRVNHILGRESSISRSKFSLSSPLPIKPHQLSLTLVKIIPKVSNMIPSSGNKNKIIQKHSSKNVIVIHFPVQQAIKSTPPGFAWFTNARPGVYFFFLSFVP